MNHPLRHLRGNLLQGLSACVLAWGPAGQATLAVIAWLKQQAPMPVWLVGTSRGTQSVGDIATESGPAQGGPRWRGADRQHIDRQRQPRPLKA